jgi:hypothetical protein
MAQRLSRIDEAEEASEELSKGSRVSTKSEDGEAGGGLHKSSQRALI